MGFFIHDNVPLQKIPRPCSKKYYEYITFNGVFWDFGGYVPCLNTYRLEKKITLCISISMTHTVVSQNIIIQTAKVKLFFFISDGHVSSNIF